MKIILLLTGASALLLTSGCLVSEGRGHGHHYGHGRYEHRETVIVGPPVVEVRPPVVIVH